MPTTTARTVTRPLAGIAAAALALLAAPLSAQDTREDKAPDDAGGFLPGVTASASVALTSDYRFRGVSFSDGDPAIQGSVVLSHDSGLYAGVWGSSLEDSDTFGSVELDLYAGYSAEVASGITADAGLLYYYYPNGDERLGGPSDYFEPYASLAGQLGPVQAKAGVAYAFGGQSALGDRDSLYLYTDLSSGVPTTPITLNAHLGYTDGVLSTAADGDSFDYSLGADYALTPALTVGARYVGVGGPRVDDVTDDTVVFTLSASF